jgi:RHS repeat-associated protein
MPTTEVTCNPVASGPTNNPNYSAVSSTRTTEYDGLSRATKVTEPNQSDDGVNEIHYETGKDRVEWTRAVNGAYTLFNYDGAGRVDQQLSLHDSSSWSSVINVPAVAQAFTFNANGAVTEVRVQHAAATPVPFSLGACVLETTITRDSLDRPTLLKDEISLAKVDLGWNTAGQLTSRKTSTTTDGTTYRVIAEDSNAFYGNGELQTATDTRTSAAVTYAADRVNNEFKATGPLNVENYVKANSVGYRTEGNVKKGATVDRSFKVQNNIVGQPESVTIGGDTTAAPTKKYTLAGSPMTQTVPDLNNARVAVANSGDGSATVVSLPMGVASRTELDQLGNPTKVTENADGGASSRPNQSSMNRNTREAVFCRSSVGIRSQYDRAGGLTAKTYYYSATAPDSLGSPTGGQQFMYDGYGRIVEQTRMDGSKLKSVYYPDTDANPCARRQLKEVQTASGVALRALQNYNVFGEPKVLIEYTQPGTPSKQVKITRAYYGENGVSCNGFGQLASETTEIVDGTTVPNSTFTVSYTYDLAGKRATMTYTGGGNLNYHYDNDIRIKDIEYAPASGAPKKMVDYTFDPVYKVPTSKTVYNTPVTINWKSKYLGLVAGISVAGQSAFVCAYNDLGLKKELGYWSSGSSTRSVLYDGLLRPNTISTGVGDKFSSESITLNGQDRRTTATIDGSSVSYGFTTANGPELSDTVTASAAFLAANGAPRRIGVTQPADGVFAYDARRNLTQDERYIYTWDDFDRIVKVEDKLAANPASEGVPAYVEYRYDAAGRRIGHLYSTNSNGLWPSERAVYDGAQLIEERDWTSGALVRRYFYEPDGKPVAVHEDTNGDAAIDATETVYVLVTDDRGSVIGVLGDVNGVATLVEKLHYNSTGLTKTYQADNATPWTDATGAPLARPKHVRLGFTGMYCEPFTGKYHTHYREYDPLHNWWLSPDPIAEDGGINLIAFCKGDAVNGIDPHGLEANVVEMFMPEIGIKDVTYGDISAWNDPNPRLLNTTGVKESAVAVVVGPAAVAVVGATAYVAVQTAPIWGPWAFNTATAAAYNPWAQAAAAGAFFGFFNAHDRGASPGQIAAETAGGATFGIFLNYASGSPVRLPFSSPRFSPPCKTSGNCVFEECPAFGGACGGTVQSGQRIGPTIENARLLAAKSETVIVRHYTDTATRGLINESGNLRAGSYVTLPSEIPPRAGHLQIEDILEINPGRGSTYIDVPTPASNLRIPANGPTTSGSAWQRQLIEPTPVDPNLWRRPPGRPAGGG